MVDASEYWDEATFLWLQRRHAVGAPNYSRQQFRDLDERLAAQVDALSLQADAGWRPPIDSPASADDAEMFVAGLLCLRGPPSTSAALTGLLVPSDGIDGLIAALCWSPLSRVEAMIRSMSRSPTPLEQYIGVAACAGHRIEPDIEWQTRAQNPSTRVRAASMQALGVLGRVDLLPLVLEALTSESQLVRMRAANAAVLLGDRRRGLDALMTMAFKPGPHRRRAMRLALMTLDCAGGHDLLRQAYASEDSLRVRVMGCGLVGDARYVPWLIEQMNQPALARVAAEAFVSVTGADFNLDQLESMPPEGQEEGPSDDPDDDEVEVPEDVALPWPDVERVKTWWHDNHARFAAGTRLFLGQPVSAGHCIDVLERGHQRQRVVAAHHMALLEPGRVLFPTSAPAWRQDTLLQRVS